MAQPGEASSIANGDKFNLNIAGQSYTLYTHSYLGYGGEQAREMLTSALPPKADLVKDPCLQVGFSRSRDTKRSDVFGGSGTDGVAIEGDSDKDSCLKSVKKYVINSVDPKSCVHEIGGQYTMDCQSQPKWVTSAENFLVFENFFWAASGTHVLKDGHKSSDVEAPTQFPLVTTPKEYKDAAQEVCDLKWDQLMADYPKDGQDKSNNDKWCFMLSYATSFLIDGLKLPLTKEITVQRNVGDSEIEWALGAVYKELEDLFSTNVGNLRGPSAPLPFSSTSNVAATSTSTSSAASIPPVSGVGIKENSVKLSQEEDKKETEAEEESALEEDKFANMNPARKAKYIKWKAEKEASKSSLEKNMKQLEARRKENEARQI